MIMMLLSVYPAIGSFETINAGYSTCRHASNAVYSLRRPRHLLPAYVSKSIVSAVAVTLSSLSSLTVTYLLI
jgi:hypothetical protein